MKKNFDVTGMTCSACSNRVEKAVAGVPGVEDVSVNLLKNSMTVNYDETKTGLEQIIQAVTNAGYGANEKQAAGSPAAKSVDPALAAKKEAAQMKTRLYVSLFFAAILMVLAMGPMVGMPLPEVMSGTKGAPINALTQFLLALPVVFVNFKYFTVGFKTLWWCAFLTAMLYGINSRERDKAGFIADKNRYAPWDGGSMSGRLECHADGADLTITRATRRQTAPMADFQAVYTGTASPVDGLTGTNCGETLLGVSREVFERSAFIRQSGLAITQDAGLERRVASLISSGDEDTSYTEAYDALKKQLNRRRFNKSGQLPALEAELAEVQQQLDSSVNFTL